MPAQVQIEVVTKDKSSEALKAVADSVDTMNKKVEESANVTQKSSGTLSGFTSKLNFAIDPISLATKAIEMLVNAAKAATIAFAEGEVVSAQLNAVLQSTGGAAGMTRDELDNLADSLSKMSGVDDEVIARGEALLLTFTKIHSDTFPAATLAALNMSQAMGTDLQSSIIQVGKALNEPIEGVSALRRVGVQLTDAQEEQVKAFMEVNDIASAQKIILDELNTEFGGVAEMMGDTATGSAQKLKVEWENLMQTMGESSAGSWRSTNEALTKFISSINDSIDATHEIMSEEERLSGTLDSLSNQLIDNIITYDEYTAAVARAQGQLEKEDWAAGEKAAYGYSEAIREVAAATNEINYDDLISGIQDYQNATDTYKEKNADLVEKESELIAKRREALAELQSVSAQYGAYSEQAGKAREAVQKITGELDSNGEALKANEQKYKDWAAQTVFAFAQARAAADGNISEIEGEILIQAGESLGLFDQQTSEAMRNVNTAFDTLDASNAEDVITTLTDSLMQLTSQDWTITVNTVTNGGGGGGNIPLEDSYATGGTVTAGNPVMVGETGPEPFIPAVNGRILGHSESLHALSMGGGGGQTNYIYGPVTLEVGGDGAGLMEMR